MKRALLLLTVVAAVGALALAEGEAVIEGGQWSAYLSLVGIGELSVGGDFSFTNDAYHGDVLFGFITTPGVLLDFRITSLRYDAGIGFGLIMESEDWTTTWSWLPTFTIFVEPFDMLTVGLTLGLGPEVTFMPSAVLRLALEF